MNGWCRLRALLRETRPLANGFRILARTLPRIDRGRSAALLVSTVVAAGGTGRHRGDDRDCSSGASSRTRRSRGRRSWLILALPALLLLLQIGQLAGTSIGQVLKRKIDGDLRRRVLRLSMSPAGVAHLEDPELLSLYGAARNLSPFTFTPGDAAVQLTGRAHGPACSRCSRRPVLAWFEPLAGARADRRLGGRPAAVRRHAPSAS